MAVMAPLQHRLRRDNFLAEPGGRGLDIYDDALNGIDQIIGLLAEPARAVFERPCRFWAVSEIYLGGLFLGPDCAAPSASASFAR